MVRYVHAAAVHFEANAGRGQPDAQAKVLAQFKEAADELDGTGVDLLLTCEGMESLGQTPEQAESPDRPGPLFDAYAAFARRNRCTVAGSLKLADHDRIHNALVYIGPDGHYLGDYRKTHLTDGEKERGLTPGRGATVVDTPAGRLGGVICFDLNFDSLRDAYRRLAPDFLLFSSMFHGDHLQRNWAYICRAFLLSACKDTTSDLVDPLGRVVASTNYHGRIVRARVNLDRFLMHQDGNRERFGDIRRAYPDEVDIDYNPSLAVAALYSRSTRRTAAEIAAEFGLVALDDYLQGTSYTEPR